MPQRPKYSGPGGRRPPDMWWTLSCSPPPPPGSVDRRWLERCVSVACALLSYPFRPERFIRPRCIPQTTAPPPPHHFVILQWYGRAESVFIQEATSILGKHSTQHSQKTVTAKPICNWCGYWTAIIECHILLFLWWMLVSYLKHWICQINLL